MDSAHSRSDRLLIAIAFAEAAAIVVLAIALCARETPAGAHNGAVAPVAQPSAPPASTPADLPAAAAAAVPAGISAHGEVGVAPPSLPSRSEGTLLCGVVTSRSGALPRRGTAGVYLHAGDAATQFAQSWLSWPTSEFAFPGLHPGSYRLVLRGQGLRDLEREVEVPADRSVVRVELQVEPTWRLRVLIATPEGEPLRKALANSKSGAPDPFRGPTVFATIDPPPSPLPLSSDRDVAFGIGQWNDADRRFGRGDGDTLPARYAGTLDLPEDRPYHVSVAVRSQLLATERVEPGQDEVRLVVPVNALQGKGVVRLRVVDASRAPIAGVKVSVGENAMGGQGTPTDSDGRVEFSGLLPGLLQVGFAMGSDWALPPWQVSLPAGAVVDLGDLTAIKKAKCTLRFSGRPADVPVNASLLLLDAPPHPALTARSFYTPFGAEDECTLDVVPGRYRLSANCGTLAATTTIEVAAGSSEPIAIALQPGAPLRIVPPRGRVVELQLLDRGGASVLRAWLRSTTKFDLPLLPGEYRAVVRGLDGSSSERIVTVGGAAGATLDLR